MLRLLQSACVRIMNDAARAGERNQLDGRGRDGKHCDTGAMAERKRAGQCATPHDAVTEEILMLQMAVVR
jgi:hypothetical protein